MTRLETNIILFCVVLCASVSLLYECSLPPNLSSQMIVFATCGMAFPLVAMAGARHFKSISLSTLWKGAILAAILALYISLQWDDCTYLPPAIVSGYSSLEVLFVPFFMLLLGKNVSKDQAAAILFVVIGLFVMRGLMQNPQALLDHGHHNVYEPILSTLVSSVLLVVTSVVVQKEDPIAVTIVQLMFATLIGGAWFLINPGPVSPASLSGQVYGQLFTISFFGTGLLFFLNNVVQRYAAATDVAIITSLTPFTLLLLAAYMPKLYFSNFDAASEAAIGAIFIAIGACISGQRLVHRLTCAITHKPVEPDQDYNSQAAPAVKDEDNTLNASDIGKFVLVVVAFLVIAMPFKTLSIIPGVTELRPVNAVPYLAGMFFGLPGAFGSAMGNLLSDTFGTLSIYSAAGALANFLAAWIPFRLWHRLRTDEPNIQTPSAVWVGFLVCLIAAASVALTIGFAYSIGGESIDVNVTQAIFINHFFFSLLLGLPFLAVIQKSNVLPMAGPTRYRIFELAAKRLGNAQKALRLSWAGCIAMSVLSLLSIALVCLFGLPFLSVPVVACGAICLALFALLCV